MHVAGAARCLASGVSLQRFVREGSNSLQIDFKVSEKEAVHVFVRVVTCVCSMHAIYHQALNNTYQMKIDAPLMQVHSSMDCYTALLVSLQPTTRGSEQLLTRTTCTPTFKGSSSTCPREGSSARLSVTLVGTGGLG